jgi:hypothetical protein
LKEANVCVTTQSCTADILNHETKAGVCNFICNVDVDAIVLYVYADALCFNVFSNFEDMQIRSVVIVESVGGRFKDEGELMTYLETKETNEPMQDNV